MIRSQIASVLACPPKATLRMVSRSLDRKEDLRFPSSFAETARRNGNRELVIGRLEEVLGNARTMPQDHFVDEVKPGVGWSFEVPAFCS